MFRKSQSSIEFIILVAAVLFFFVLFYSIIADNIDRKARDERSLEVKNLALDIQNEINLAHSSTEGYTRTFDIPVKINGLDYSIAFVDKLLYIQSDRDSLAVPVPSVEGELIKGKNTIQKKEGQIFLNS